ncbi:High-affinity iron permease [Candidatus Burkholderia pumila]|uniref:High-affinity iron permease n=1 Tax=Candidatus Burkholderia pumila TaxID=1090375 RepID=A0ABR5HKA8_9BURK|nr:High-affinity iron permease [Candidatus Burkholderia pumila]
MGQVLFIVWRESVEALLVVGILYAWLKNGDQQACRSLPYLWGGMAIGLIAAIALGAALIGFTEVLSGDAQDYFQIGIMLVACVLIVQMVLWMKKHGRTLKKNMESSLQKSTQDGHFWGIAVLVALAIAREGSEIAVFLYGVGFGQSGHVDASQYLAILIGFALALLTFYVLQLGGKIFSWRSFFRVTEIMLLFLAAGLFETSVDKLIDMEILPVIVNQVWNTSALFDDSSTFGLLVATLTGYRAHPAGMNLVAYVVYWIVIYLLLCRANMSMAQKQKAAGRPA